MLGERAFQVVVPHAQADDTANNYAWSDDQQGKIRVRTPLSSCCTFTCQSAFAAPRMSTQTHFSSATRSLPFFHLFPALLHTHLSRRRAADGVPPSPPALRPLRRRALGLMVSRAFVLSITVAMLSLSMEAIPSCKETVVCCKKWSHPGCTVTHEPHMSISPPWWVVFQVRCPDLLLGPRAGGHVQGRPRHRQPGPRHGPLTLTPAGKLESSHRHVLGAQGGQLAHSR